MPHIRPIFRPVFACFAVAIAASLGLTLTPEARAQTDESAAVLPGDDFFAYANSAWLKATTIPAGKPSWGARAEIAQKTQEQLLRLLDDAKSAPAGSSARQVADFRAAFMDETAIEGHGIAPLKASLARISRVRDKAGLTRLLGSMLRADVDPLNWGVFDSSHVIGLAVGSGAHGEKEYLAYLLQGGLGLPGRAHYLEASSDMQARREQYVATITRVLAQLGAEHAAPATDPAARAAAVMALETAIARSHATPEASGDEHNADTTWTRADFAREAPGMDWTVFFAAAGLARQRSFVVWNPAALKAVAALVDSQPAAVWRDYLRVHLVERYSDVLPKRFAVRPVDRAQRAVDATQTALGDAMGRMYAERYFPAASKAKVQAIAANVISEFARRVEAAPWLSPQSRAVALAKLHGMYFGVGYPERWTGDPALTVNATDPVGNLMRVERRDYRRALARLGRPVDRFEWHVAAQWPGAAIFFEQNAYNFAAALLQAPKFDASAPDAANYGAIGAIIGHEVSHFVDTLGSEYDASGHRHRWWTADDTARYRAASEALVAQFSSYTPFADVAVDGKRGLSENVADLGGLAAAFDAHRRALGNKAADKEYAKQQDRLFFIGFAQAWRIKYTDDALRKQAATDHSPEIYRVWTVRNIDAWYDAFDVKPGQRMYLPPQARVRVW